VKEAVKSFGWTILEHPAKSPDISPCDMFAFRYSFKKIFQIDKKMMIFRSLQNFLDGNNYGSREDLEEAIQNWIDSRPKDFWRKGMEKLPTMWQNVVDAEGKYVEE
jgi:hypothetical protein